MTGYYTNRIGGSAGRQTLQARNAVESGSGHARRGGRRILMVHPAPVGLGWERCGRGTGILPVEWQEGGSRAQTQCRRLAYQPTVRIRPPTVTEYRRVDSGYGLSADGYTAGRAWRPPAAAQPPLGHSICTTASANRSPSSLTSSGRRTCRRPGTAARNCIGTQSPSSTPLGATT